MKEIYGDAFELLASQKYDTLCITTNGTVRKDGACVMGRGIALAIQNYFPRINYYLGQLIKQNGNIVQVIHVTEKGTTIIAFPVKHNWWEKADLSLIKESCHQLIKLIDKKKLTSILLPRPGCGNGKLDWKEVKPEIELILDDRVSIVHWKK